MPEAVQARPEPACLVRVERVEERRSLAGRADQGTRRHGLVRGVDDVAARPRRDATQDADAHPVQPLGAELLGAVEAAADRPDADRCPRPHRRPDHAPEQRRALAERSQLLLVVGTVVRGGGRGECGGMRGPLVLSPPPRPRRRPGELERGRIRSSAGLAEARCLGRQSLRETGGRRPRQRLLEAVGDPGPHGARVLDGQRRAGLDPHPELGREAESAAPRSRAPSPPRGQPPRSAGAPRPARDTAPHLGMAGKPRPGRVHFPKPPERRRRCPPGQATRRGRGAALAEQQLSCRRTARLQGRPSSIADDCSRLRSA